jgi:hypothetical protein
MELLAGGFMYISKRDMRGRVNLVLDVSKIAKVPEVDTPNVQLAVSFLLTYVIEKCFVPGKAETWNMIIDLNGLGVTELPRDKMKQILGSAQLNFRGRANKIFILNAPMLVRGSFKVAKTFLDEFTVQKISLMGDDF